MSNISFTIKATPNQYGQAGVAINGQLTSPDTSVTNSYWFAVIDRWNATIAFQVGQTSNTVVPPQLANYNSSRYLLAVVTVNLSTLNVPQGALYTFLLENGAGVELQRLEQINADLSCGEISTVSYALVTAFQDNSVPGFEQGAYQGNGVILTLQLMQVSIDGQNVWTPVALS
jgi:hypothetical protein